MAAEAAMTGDRSRRVSLTSSRGGGDDDDAVREWFGDDPVAQRTGDGTGGERFAGLGAQRPQVSFGQVR